MSAQTVDTPDEEQHQLAEFATDDSCQAIAESTGEQCRRDRITEYVPYCSLHLHLFDPDTDIEQTP